MSTLVELTEPMTTETGGQRLPPHKLVLIHEEDWDDPDCTRWGGSEWTGDDAGRFIDPTETQPLLFVINMDQTLLKAHREGMVNRKTPGDEKTVNAWMKRYITAVATHLRQLFFLKQKATNPPPGGKPRQPSEEELQEEVNRIGESLFCLMQQVTAR